MVLLDLLVKQFSFVVARSFHCTMVKNTTKLHSSPNAHLPIPTGFTKFIQLSKETEDLAVSQACAVLSSEGIVAVPTDTIYGVASLLHSFQRLYHLKRRSALKPLAICVASVQEIPKYAHVPVSLELLNLLLPGPVTVVLPRLNTLPSQFNAECSSIGVRVPNCSFMNKLCKCYEQPLALTSANLSNAHSSLSVKEFENLWPEIDLIVDGGSPESQSRAGSTVVDLTVGGVYRIIRKGSAFLETESILLRPEFGLKKLE